MAAVTVSQYQGPNEEFDTPEEYAAWLIKGWNDPDWAVNLVETWHLSDPTEIRKFQARLDELCDAAGLEEIAE